MVVSIIIFFLFVFLEEEGQVWGTDIRVVSTTDELTAWFATALVAGSAR